MPSDTQDGEDFALIEALLWDGTFHRVERHVARLRESAGRLGFDSDVSRYEAALRAQERRLINLPAGSYKVRLVLERTGELWSEAEPLGATDGGEVMIASNYVHAGDALARHKTSRRVLYDLATTFARSNGLVDLLFLNERGELAEAASSNVFVLLDGELLTPRVEAGILPGVYRQHVLETDPRAREELLVLADLLQAEAIYLCNSVRGWREVRLRPGRGWDTCFPPIVR